MITDDLFEEVLIKPISLGADHLYIVSGYATSAMAFHHLERLQHMQKKIYIELIIGMSPLDGISLTNHRGFQELMKPELNYDFSCSYLTESPPVHSKIYSWFNMNKPICSFVGSANYTQIAFGARQKEVLTESDPNDGLNYFQKLIPQTIYCNNDDATNFVQIYDSNNILRRRRESESHLEQEPQRSNPSLIGLPSVEISFLDRSGHLPTRSGLNWGQRPKEHREPNQAYIRIPANVGRTDFFPDRRVQFTVLTDDERVMVCARAQDNGKAIQTPSNNSLIGEYFRNRLGVPNGQKVTLVDLQRYGRTNVTFYKIDDETFYLDFAPHRDG